MRRICDVNLLHEFVEYLEDISDRNAKIALNHELLLGILTFLDNYTDVIDGEDGEPRANRAMQLVVQFENLPYEE